MTDQARSPGSPRRKSSKTPANERSATPPVERALEDEMTTLRAEMRSHIADSEVRDEEARTAYAELLAVNVGLRTAAQGLETSGEELRSRNRELQVRIDDIGQTNEDLRAELTANRQQILEQLVAATEEERHRIARELHDEMGQHITALKVGLEALPESGHVRDLKEIAMRLDRTVDRLVLALRQAVLDDLGLVGALGSLVDAFTYGSGIPADFHESGIDGDRLPPAVESTLYRVLQEALTNVWKHAAAKNVSVIVERKQQQVQLIIEDNGAGFLEADAAHGERLGLIGIRERVALIGGSVSIESALGHGTTLYVRVPLDQPENPT